jgi:hypothetical protein
VTASIQQEGSPQGPPSRRRRQRLIAPGFLVAVGILCSGNGAALAQAGSSSQPAEPATAVSDPPSPWAFRVTPYGWLTWMSGSQTIKGRTADIDTNVFQLLGNSQSLIPFMGYFEARFEDRIEVFVDVMYANISAGQSATRNFRVGPFVSGSVTASASEDYEQATVQFGGAFQVAKVGRDRSAEGPGMAGVGQTAFDVLLGGRYWHLEADTTLNLAGTIGVNVGDLELSRDGSRAVARSGNINWVDPFVGFRVRHKLAPGQDLQLEADIGGFGLGSRISWQALAAYSYTFGHTGGVAWAGVLGYRALYVDYIQGSGNTLFETNLLQHGPLIGISARF